MVFHRLLGKIEVICDFFIAKTATNQGDELLFASCQSPLCVLLFIREVHGLRRHIVKQDFRVMSRAYGVSLRDRPDRRYNICGGGILQDVTPRTSTYRRQKGSSIICHGDEHALDRLVMSGSCGWRSKVIKQKVQ